MVTRINYWFDTGNTRLKMRSEVPTNVDTVIVGGGVAGLNTLYYLLSRKVNAVLLDEADIGFYASGRSNGVFGLPPILGFEDNFQQVYDLVRLNNRLIRTTLIKENIPCSFNYTGEMQLSVNDAQFKHENVLSIKSGLTQLIPSKEFKRGFYIPVANTFNTYQFLYGLSAVCELTGPRCFGHTAVEGFEEHKDHMIVHIRDSRTIKCKNIVLCCDSHIAGDSNLVFRKSLLGSMCTKSIFSSKKESPFLYIPTYILDNNIRLSFYDGRIFVDFVGGLKRCNDVRDILGDYFDFFNVHDFEYEWAGAICSTDDGFPLIGQLSDRIYVNTAHGRHGLSYAALGGWIIADYIEKGQTQIINTELFSPTRFGKEM